GVGRLLVMDGETFAGIVSRSDLMTALDIIRSSGSLSATDRLRTGRSVDPPESSDPDPRIDD
ncbi:MAG: metalloprotease, partial [Haloarculaceae archaeon]